MRKVENECGRTMLEMLGVLAIMGVIMYGAIAGIGFGVTMYQINAAFNDIEEAAQGIMDLYSWRRGYPKAATIVNAMTNNDIIDAEPTTDGFNGRFGGSSMMIVTETDDDDASYDHFYIVYTGIDDTACTRLSYMNYSSNVMIVKEARDGVKGYYTHCGGEDGNLIVLKSR